MVSQVEPQRAQNNLCDLCVLGTTCDPNFVTFVLFVVINCVTTKDAKHTKEETQRTPSIIKITNSKSEIQNNSECSKNLNSKQIRFGFRILDLSVSVCLRFRAWDFGVSVEN